MCNPRKLAQDVMLSRAASAAWLLPAAAADSGRNYNSTHHAAVVDKAAVAALSISSFICTRGSGAVRFHLSGGHARTRWHHLSPSVRLSVVRLYICLFDTLHAYAIFIAPLSQFISCLRPQLPPLLDGSTDCATLWGSRLSWSITLRGHDGEQMNRA